MNDLLRYQDGHLRLPALAGYMRERYVHADRWLGAIETDFTIKKGLVNVQKLLMDSHDFQSTGHGTVGLDQTLSLRLNLNFSQALSQKIAASSPIAKVAISGGRLSVPLIIGGTIHAPSYGLDTTRFAGEVQEQVKQRVREAVDDLLQGKAKPEDLKQQGKTLLKDLFGK